MGRRHNNCQSILNSNYNVIIKPMKKMNRKSLLLQTLITHKIEHHNFLMIPGVVYVKILV